MTNSMPPAVNLDLSLMCAERDHDHCPGCDLCTCHDRGPTYMIAANLFAAAGFVTEAPQSDPQP